MRAALPGERTVLVHLWRREQGLVVAPGNPLGIRGVADLAGHRLADRVAVLVMARSGSVPRQRR